MTTPVHSINNLRLRVGTRATTDTGLANLIANPHGDLGTWAWATPVTNSALSVVQAAGLNYLRLAASGTPTATIYAQSSRYRANPSAYASARIDVGTFTPAGGSGTLNVRVRVDFWTSAGVAAGSSDYSAFVATPGTTLYTLPAVVPATAAYASVRVELYRGTGLATSGDAVTFRATMLATGTQAQLGYASQTYTLTNKVTNPNFEGTGAGSNALWTVTGNGTKTAAVFNLGGNSTYLYRPFDGVQQPQSLHSIALAAGDVIEFDLYTTSARKVYVWTGTAFNNGFVGLTPIGTTTASTWKRWRYVVPAAITGFIIGTEKGSDSVYFLDNVSVLSAADDAQAATEYGSSSYYFDGSTPAVSQPGPNSITTKAFSWTGSVGASASREVYTKNTVAFGYVDAVTNWTDLLGPATELSITRAPLDPGTLAATLREYDGEQSQVADIDPGAPVSLEALIADVWEPVYTGTLTDISMAYSRDDNDRLVATVSLAAADATTDLDSSADARIPAAIADAPAILESAGVRYRVNGSTAQIPTFTPAASPADGSTLDALVTLRDTVFGYIAVSRDGWVNAWDRAAHLAASTAPLIEFTDVWPATFDTPEDEQRAESYTAIAPAFGLDQACTMASIKVLSGTASTEFGPYYAASTVGQPGQRLQSFVIALTAATDANAHAWADTVFAVHAQPALSVAQVTYAVKDTRGMAHATITDLYDPVTVTLNGVTTDHLVSGITHQITPDAWTVVYDLTTPDARIY